MKNLMSLLNALKWNFFKTWMFFFVLSMMGWTRHTMFELLLISAVWSAGIIAVAILFIKIKERFGK